MATIVNSLGRARLRIQGRRRARARSGTSCCAHVGWHGYKVATSRRAARDADLDGSVRSGPRSGMHWNVMMGAANFVRGPTFDPVAQLVEQRTFKACLPRKRLG